MNYALVSKATNLVVNLIVAEPDDPIPDEFFTVADYPTFVTIGTAWNGEAFVPPPEPEHHAPPKIDGLDTL